MGTARRGSIKVSAVVGAAVLSILGPGLSPLTAGAQEQPPAEDALGPWVPAGPIGGKPKDSGGPDKTYLNRVQCITSASTQENVAAGDILRNGPWGQRHLRIRDVQQHVREKSKWGKVGVNEETGKPLTVAVIDTGVTPHPFFQGRVKAGGDYVEKAGKGKDGLLDCDGHGTQVAGIIAGNPDSSDIGFIGVAPDAEILSIRQSSQNYSEKTPDEIKADREKAKQEREAAAQEAEAKQKEAEFEAKQQELEEKLRREEERNDNQDEDGATGSSQQGGDQGPDEPRAQETQGGAGNLGTLAEAIVRAVDSGADVINMSVDACRPNTGDYKPLEDEPKVRAAVKYAADKNVVVVAAAGNAAPPDSVGGCVQNDLRTKADPRMPDPNHPRTIVTPPWFSADGTMLAVGAVDKDGSVAEFSMRGPWVSVAAPGTEIISLDPAEGSKKIVNVTFDGSNEESQAIQGTSFASPYVAGLAVLVKQTHPDLNAREVIKRIEATALHPGAANGRDQFVGYGVIDPMAAVTANLPQELGIPGAKDRTLPSDMPPPHAEDSAPMVVALAGSAGGIAALGVTIFVVRSVRRRQSPTGSATG